MNSEHVVAFWILALIYMGIVWWGTPKEVTSSGFFTGRNEEGKEPSLWLLVASAAISWLFAKSIVNAANLANDFGFLGGVGYGVYYLSFVVAGVVFYIIRTRKPYESLPAFVQGKYGTVGMRLFLIAVAIRLYNEVWSNTKVVGTFFGSEGSVHYWLAVLGNLPLLTIYMGDQIGPAIIAATTISGTMVTGLAPVILLSFMPTSATNFHLAFWPGLLLGGVLAFMPSVFPRWVPIYPVDQSVTVVKVGTEPLP